MPFKPWPLFRLPLLAMEIVIKQMDHKELFSLSLTSKKAYFYVKQLHAKSSNMIVNLDGRKQSSVNLVRLENGRRKVIYYISVMENYSKTRIPFVKNAIRDDHYCTFWEDRMFGIRAMAEHLSDLFDLKIDTIHVAKETIWMMDFVENRQGKSTYKAIIGEDPHPKDERVFFDEDFRRVLEHDPRELVIQEAPPSGKNFRIEDFNKKFESLTVFKGSWVSLDNLKSLNSIKIFIYDKVFTKEEINQFVRHWRAGGAPNLKYLRTSIERGNSETILRNNHEAFVGGQYNFQIDEGNFVIFPGCIVRRRGVVATMGCGFPCAGGVPFIFGAWPDFGGKQFPINARR